MKQAHPFVTVILHTIWAAICPLAVLIANPVFLFSEWYIVVLVVLPTILLTTGIVYKRIIPTRYDKAVVLVGSPGCLVVGVFHLEMLEYFKHAL
jgi:hypothetical protein